MAQTSKQINNLKPGATYNVQIRAISGDKNSEWSNIYSFTTPSAQVVSENNYAVQVLAAKSEGVAGGAVIAGAFDKASAASAGKLDLANLWNGSASLSGSANLGGMIMNSTGLLGYKFNSADISASTAAKFFLSTADGNAYFRGTIFAASGQIGGWNIGASSLYAGSGSTYVAMSTGSYPFWAGAVNPANAKFSVTNAGVLSASGGIFTNGTFNGGQITGTSINVGNGKFVVDGSGNLTATGASVSGNISASSGSFSGSVYANTGSFSGSIYATTGSFSGSVYATDGEFKGTIKSGTVITGSLTATTASISGGAYVGSLFSSGSISGATFDNNNGTFKVDVNGNLQATSASISGSIQATGIFTGSLSAGAVIAGSITANTASISGATYTGSLFSAGSVVGSTLTVPNAASPKFTVDSGGNLTATSASIKGDIKADSGYFAGSVVSGAVITGTISASTATITGLTQTGSLFSAGSITGTQINIPDATSPLFKVTSTGYMTATGASIAGQITAQSGSITGDLTISSAGRLIAGNLGTNAVVVSGSGITGTQTGIPTFYLPTDGSPPIIGGFEVVKTGLITPDSASTTVSGASGQTTITVGSSSALYVGMSASGTGIASAALITGISGNTVSLSVANTSTVSGTGTFTPNSNLIVGTLTNNITVRGQTAGGVLPAIFTTISGSATTATSGSGFYVGQDGKFRLAGTNGFVSMDGSGNLSVSGSVTATAGYIGSSTNGWVISSSAIKSSDTKITIQSGSAAKIYSGNQGTYQGALTPFYMDASGKFSLADKLFFDGTDLTLTGSVVAASGTIGGISIASNKIYTGSGNYGNADTGFYVDNTGRFSLEDKFTWDPNTNALVVNGSGSFSGSISATSGSISGALTIGGTTASTVVSNAAEGASAVQPGNGVEVNNSDQIKTIKLNNAGIQIYTASSGQRITLDNTGFYAYNVTGSTVAISSDGSASFTGTINANAGYIGSSANGWIINSSYISSQNNTSGSTTLYSNAFPVSANTYGKTVVVTASGNNTAYMGIYGSTNPTSVIGVSGSSGSDGLEIFGRAPTTGSAEIGGILQGNPAIYLKDTSGSVRGALALYDGIGATKGIALLGPQVNNIDTKLVMQSGSIVMNAASAIALGTKDQTNINLYINTDSNQLLTTNYGAWIGSGGQARFMASAQTPLVSARTDNTGNLLSLYAASTSGTSLVQRGYIDYTNSTSTLSLTSTQNLKIAAATDITISPGTSQQTTINGLPIYLNSTQTASSTNIVQFRKEGGDRAVLATIDGQYTKLYSNSGYDLRLDTQLASDVIRIGDTASTTVLASDRTIISSAVSASISAPNTIINSAASVVGGFTMQQAVYATASVHGYDAQGKASSRAMWITGSADGYRIGVNPSSTERIKQQITNYEWDIDKVLSLEPKRFKYNLDVEEHGDQAQWWYGFIAEKAAELGLEWLIGRDSEGIPDYFSYEKMPVVLHSIIRQQQQQIKTLEERLAALEAKVI